MWKKFIHGLIFGTGFALALILVFAAYIHLILPYTFSDEPLGSSDETVGYAPVIDEPSHYLGPSLIIIGDNSATMLVLDSGPGHISGSVTAVTDPEGLKLRLALNGSLWSQWADVDSQGNYNISVPFGEYQVNGFELDFRSADKVLPNQISHPNQRLKTQSFVVSEEENGAGLALSFVEPVVKLSLVESYDNPKDVILRWQPYQGASKYLVRLSVKDSADASRSSSVDTQNKLIVETTELKLKEHSIPLEKSKYYTFEVLAADEFDRLLSKSVSKYGEYDFYLK